METETKTTKSCIYCKELKLLSDFYKSKLSKDGHMPCCKICNAERAKKWLKAKKERLAVDKINGYQEMFEHSEKIKETKSVPGRKEDARKSRLFAFWQSLPGSLKDEEYFKKIKNIKLTEEQQTLLPKLLKAKNLKEVSVALGVSYTAVMGYQKSIYVKKMTEYFDRWNNAISFRRDVDYAFTQAVLKHADAPRVKLWKQLYEGWVEKNSQVHELDQSNIIEIQGKLKELAEKKKSENIEKPIKLNDILNVSESEQNLLPAKVRRDNESSWSDPR